MLFSSTDIHTVMVWSRSYLLAIVTYPVGARCGSWSSEYTELHPNLGFQVQAGVLVFLTGFRCAISYMAFLHRIVAGGMAPYSACPHVSSKAFDHLMATSSSAVPSSQNRIVKLSRPG